MTSFARPSGVPSRFRWSIPDKASSVWQAVALGTVLLLELTLALSRAINWDEFWHLSQVHNFMNGTLGVPLQTVYARAFGWVVLLPGSGIDHILTIRLFMFACLTATTGCIFAMADRFVGRSVALLAGLLYLSAGFVLQHGSSFRSDPMAAMLLSASLLILLRTRLHPPALLTASALIALAGLLTLKSGLYAPAFFGVAWLRWTESGRDRAMLLRLVAVAVLAIPVFVVFYQLHSGGLASGNGGSSEFIVSNSAQRMFAIQGLGTLGFAQKAALTAPVFAICIVITPVLLWKSGLNRNVALALAGFWLPILVIAFYRNAFAYFYVFLLPPVAVASSIALAEGCKRYGAIVIAGLLTACSFAVAATEGHGVRERQQALLAAADTIFPQPVAYFDFPAMLSDYPKANGFMSTWGAMNYLEGLTPSFSTIMGQRTVPLVLENRGMFTNALAGRPDPHILPEDVVALHENYIRFWGPFWLAGREIAAGNALTTMVLVPGTYTVESGPVEIDGTRYHPGQTVELARVRYRMRAPAGDTRIVWGRHLKRPNFAPPAEPYWITF